MVNATEMAKPFGRLPKDWIKTDYANRIIKIVAVRKNVLTGRLLKVKQGGDNQGAWMHEDSASELVAYAVTGKPKLIGS